MPASHPPKRLRADYGTTGGSATRGKSPSVLNRLLQDSRLMVEQGAKSADPEVDFLVRSDVPVMTELHCATNATSCYSCDAGKVRFEKSNVPEWTVTKGFELNDGHSYANMIDHFTPPAFFKIVRGMEHEQLFVEFK
ncbi:hypothetical protein Tco_0754400 [Tanacetum coccineum]